MFLNCLIKIGTIDEQYIEDIYSVVSDKLDFSHLEKIPLGEIDANSIIYDIFDCINREVFTNIKEKLETKKIFGITKKLKKEILEICEIRINEFSPFINCIDSWFQNECDRVNVRGKNIDKISRDVFSLLASQ